MAENVDKVIKLPQLKFRAQFREWEERLRSFLTTREILHFLEYEVQGTYILLPVPDAVAENDLDLTFAQDPSVDLRLIARRIRNALEASSVVEIPTDAATNDKSDKWSEE